MRDKFQLDATIVANEFIDKYMAEANGEYVKVYLYLLRHQDRGAEVAEIADALNHTESDIKWAVAYWVRQGVLIPEEALAGAMEGSHAADRPRDGQRQAQSVVIEETDGWQAETKQEGSPRAKQRSLYTPEQVGRLAGEEDFTQLLYISQKYMNKVFTPRECEVFAYLYDALHMSSELLEYLVEYCVQGGHYSIRYLETVALDWHQRNICTIDMAKQYTASFSDEAFSVMKAFGLNERRPGDSEMDMIRRWFQQWGFTKELVLEACGRTLKATHSPSFSYADKILSEWKKAGVRSMADVKKLDEKREHKKEVKSGMGAATASLGTTAAKPAKNQFHNFEQRNTDYDGMVLERLKQRLDTP